MSPEVKALTEDDVRPHLPAGLIPWDVRAFGSVGSTNDVARRLASSGEPEGTVVVAGSQSAGRGRRGAEWFSPPGGLWLSMVLRPEVPLERAWGLSIVGAVAVASAVRRSCELPGRIKWPNDVFVSGRKLAGVMVESAGDGAFILGVGVNANVRHEDLPRNRWYEATSVMVERGEACSRSELFGRLLAETESRYSLFTGSDQRSLTDEWRSLSLVFGERVRVERGGELLEGTVFGLEEDGAVVLRLLDGRQERVLPSGDVTLMVL